MSNQLSTLLQQLNQVILGKPHQVKLSVACMLAQGHLLIEDLPGMGKTTLGQGLAKAFGLDFQRVQFTSDILPADILGANIFDREKAAFEFHKGPIFAQLVLADEINRATPKAQSALLEAMEEQQVTVEGLCFELPQPFFVIATQNPSQQIGTYPLPESQLDRFLFKVTLGYPDQSFEKLLLKGVSGRNQLEAIKTVFNADNLTQLQNTASQVLLSDHLIEYIMDLIAATRQQPEFIHGLSPRAGLALVKAAKAWALLHGRDYALPEDVQAVFMPVAEHRMQAANQSGDNTNTLLTALLKHTAIPA